MMTSSANIHTEKYKNIVQQLTELDRNVQELDRGLTGVKIKIHELFWEMVEIRKSIKPKHEA